MTAPARLLSLFLALPALAQESTVTAVDEPSADRWMYVSNATPGTRSQATTFSALPGDSGVDDRFGQFLVKFDTAAAGIPPSLGEENYTLTSLVFRATVSSGGTIYDPTQDDRFTYGEMALPDTDAGRPAELHGTGFRNDFTASSFVEDSPFGSGNGRSVRNAYALGFDGTGVPRDVSNNIGEDFDSRAWAIGQASGLSPGDAMPADTVLTFTPDVSDPAIAAYVREGLNRGFVWFTLSSLHPGDHAGRRTHFLLHERQPRSRDRRKSRAQPRGRMGGAAAFRHVRTRPVRQRLTLLCRASGLFLHAPGQPGLEGGLLGGSGDLQRPLRHCFQLTAPGTHREALFPHLPHPRRTMRISSRKNTSGFTLVELMVTVAIIATLGGVSVSGYLSIREKARMTTEINAARNLAVAYLAGRL